MTNFEIQPARKEHAGEIARGIMEAMSLECCRFLIGEGRDLADFELMMKELAGREDSQYSFRNTLVAVKCSEAAERREVFDEYGENEVLGICVGYNGGDLRQLRKAFIRAMWAWFQKDLSKIVDETQPGEFYVDSLFVKEPFRGRGIASALLKTSMKRAEILSLPRVGLLVEKANAQAERLYSRLGFQYVNDCFFGGHSMRHMQLKL